MATKVDTKILENWKSLNDSIQELDEGTLKTLLQVERSGQRRPQFLLRLYGRYNTLRCDRERKELMME